MTIPVTRLHNFNNELVKVVSSLSQGAFIMLRLLWQVGVVSLKKSHEGLLGRSVCRSAFKKIKSHKDRRIGIDGWIAKDSDGEIFCTQILRNNDLVLIISKPNLNRTPELYFYILCHRARPLECAFDYRLLDHNSQFTIIHWVEEKSINWSPIKRT